ncbi:hypothetical protein FIBSPDRAFT_1048068 [Athelia psychrophila]|uniref:Uncharacterized protein n=1 Tax=Athelia psychrophila TaxID=1759441 RepID=A0A166EAA5_9AGAM|nr:hypothetical protein FIBSPDRAFT_1048068 [Fibularhizoctonia sp. CBS 109695]
MLASNNSLVYAASTVGYLNAAIFTVIAWDILICITEELQVAVVCGLSPSIVAYFASRTGTLLLSLLVLFIQHIPIAHCEAFWLFIMITSVIATSATSFLLLARVRAVYGKSKLVASFFGLFWLAAPAVTVLIAISGHSALSVESDRCSVVENASYSAICLWIKAAFDTSVSMAITLRIISYSTDGRAPGSLNWHLLRGKGLPRIFGDLLKGGQQFYFLTIGVTLMGACTVFMPVDSIYRMGLTQPALAIESVMACRVFRNVVLSCNQFKEGTYATDNILLTTIIPYVCNTGVLRTANSETGLDKQAPGA